MFINSIIVIAAVVTQLYAFCRHATSIVQHCSIMTAGSVYVGMAQHIGHQIYIAGLAVKIRAICGSQLVRAELLFQRRGQCGILFYHYFNAAYAHALPLKRQKQRVFMAGQCCDLAALPDVILKRFSNLVGKVQYCLISAFACDREAVDFKIHIVQVYPNQLAHTDSGAKKKRQNGQITDFGLFIVFLLARRERIAGFHQIKHTRHFVYLHAQYRLFVAFGHIDKTRGVGCYQLILE